MSIQQMLFGGVRPAWADPAEDASTVKRSGRFNEADTAHLIRTMSTGDRKTWTWSAWVKRWQAGNRSTLFSAGDGTSDTGWTAIEIESNDRLKVSGWNTAWKDTSRLFRDVSAWYHIVVAFDTTEGTPTDRCKIWINGVQESEWNADNALGSDTDYAVNQNSKPLRVGGIDPAGVNNGFSNFYLSNVHFIDGQALGANYFGVTNSTTGQWVPGDFLGSYGTNGFYLAMDPANGGIGYDSSGKSNHFTDNNLFSYDATVGNDNFKAISYSGNGGDALIGGQIFSNNPTVTGGTLTNATTAFNGSSSNWATLTANSTSCAAAVDFTFPTALTGVTKIEHNFDSPSGSGDTRGRYNGSNAGATRTSAGSGYGDTYSGSAITVTSVGWGINQNSATGTSSDIVSRIRITDSSGTYILTNGQGQGSLGLTPDMVWIKQRTGSRHHYLWDSVRGFGGNKDLVPSEAVDEGDTGHQTAQYGYLAGVTGGLQIRPGTSSAIYINNSGDDYIAWCWKAGGAASSNNTGSLNASVSANTEAGFSIVSFNSGSAGNQTIAHGLGEVPKFIICKNRESHDDWVVYHQDNVVTGATIPHHNYLFLAANQASAYIADYFGEDAPTSTVFGFKSGAPDLSVNEDFIAYCWSEKSGYSKFGTFEGAATVTVDCGFTPAFLLIKDIDAAGSWAIFDNSRDSDLEINHRIYANEYAADGTDTVIGHFIGSGFTLTNEGNTNWNKTGDTFVYAAFAGNPGADLDLITDTPGTPYNNSLNGGGNYATWDSLDIRNSTAPTLSNGNLTMASSGGSFDVASSMAVRSGKWYCEFTEETKGANAVLGILGTNSVRTSQFTFGTAYKVYQNNYGSGSVSGNQSGGTGFNWVNGDILGQALDLDSSPQTLKTYQNGVLKSTCNLSAITDWRMGYIYDEGTSKSHINFGQREFAYTPPTGYKALNVYNISTPTITDPSTVFGIKAYAGNGGTTSLNYGFQPDLVWIKSRTNTYWHRTFDAIRGANVEVYPNDSAVEATGSGNSFESTGFDVASNYANNSGQNFISWAWDAGSSNTTKTAGSLNTSAYLQGEIYSNVLTGYSPAHGVQSSAETEAFNGVIGDAWDEGATTSGAGAGVYLRFTPSSQVAANTVEVYVNYYNEISFYTGSPTGTHTKVAGPFFTTTSGYFTKVNCGTVSAWDYMQIEVPSGVGSLGCYFGGIEVGGKLLVDSNVTPSNVPSVTTTYRVNTNTGLSIVSFNSGNSGQQRIAHGLNDVPKFILCKNREATNNWTVYHPDGTGTDNYLLLNNTGGASANTDIWGTSNPTSTAFGFESGTNATDNDDCIAYCWAEVAGFSKFGGWVGTGDDFIYCGFQPKFLMAKCSSQAGNWVMYDTTRVLNGFDSNMLMADSSTHEEAGSPDNYSAGQAHVDLVSNGFKVRHSGGAPLGDAGRTFIFAAWAEYPFKYANAR